MDLVRPVDGLSEASRDEHGSAGKPSKDRFVPGPIFYLITTSLALGLLGLEAYASMSTFLVGMYLFGVMVAAVIAWAVLFLLALRGRLRRSRRMWARWLGIPIIVVLCFALASVGAPFRARFELSRPAFQAAAAGYLAGDTIDGGNIGLFHVDYVDRLPNGIWFEDLSLGFIDPCGLAYSADGVPMIDYLTTDLGGGWWLACERF